MTIKTIITIFLITCINNAFSQYVLKNTEDVKWYNNIVQEQIYVHFNSNVLFTGENLYYKLYCINAKTGLKTKNSKIAYVELVGKNGVIFKHKVRLETGLSQGNYFIPTSVKTGNYKLIAYTQWMKNGVKGHFFEADITIINPYESIEFSENAEFIENKSVTKNQNNQQIKMQIDATIYGTRKEVNLKVTSLKGLNAFGNYSISVRKLNGIKHIIKSSNATIFKDKYSIDWFGEKHRIGDTIFLPEYSGEMITGIVTNKDTDNPVSEVQVAISILSEEAYQDIVKTNANGVFTFQLKGDFKQPKALFQILGDNREGFNIMVNENQSMDYATLKFKDLHLNKEDEKTIINYSIFNQIQNAYESVKKDRIVIPDYLKPFYGNHQTTYKLDDYKRFPTVAETLIEVVDHAWHERKNGKRRYINVREREFDPYYGEDLLPMVVVDGALVQDHESILYYDAKNIESISVLRDEYYYGKLVYQGVLLINTFEGDYYKNLSGNYLKQVDLFSTNFKADYFKQIYENEFDSSKIPDYRTQLYWLPDFELQRNSIEINFFTSDVKGVFQILLEGFTNKGQPISINKTFKVE